MEFTGEYRIPASRETVWAALNDHIFTFLSGVTLAQLVKQHQPNDVAVLQDHRATPKVPEPV